MSRSEDVLDDCLEGTNPSQWEAHCPPDRAAELRPLLRAAAEMDAARGIRPPETYKANGRARLYAYMLAHPDPERRAHLTAGAATGILRRLALSLVVASALFLVVGTTYAQSALPGQGLYAWKRASEDVWRAVSPNPVGVDLQLSQRRMHEMVAVSGNARAEQEAEQGYQSVLSNLSTLPEPDTRQQVLETLSSQQKTLTQAGITVPALEQALFRLSVQAPAPDTSTPTPTPGAQTATPGPGEVVPPPGDHGHNTPERHRTTPTGAASSPDDLTATPGDLTTTPDGFTATPGGFTTTPDDLTTTPGEDTSTPEDVTPTPGFSSFEPHRTPFFGTPLPTAASTPEFHFFNFHFRFPEFHLFSLPTSHP